MRLIPKGGVDAAVEARLPHRRDNHPLDAITRRIMSVPVCQPKPSWPSLVARSRFWRSHHHRTRRRALTGPGSSPGTANVEEAASEPQGLDQGGSGKLTKEKEAEASARLASLDIEDYLRTGRMRDRKQESSSPNVPSTPTTLLPAIGRSGHTTVAFGRNWAYPLLNCFKWKA